MTIEAVLGICFVFVIILMIIQSIHPTMWIGEKREGFRGLYTPTPPPQRKKSRPIVQEDGIPPVVHQLAPKNRDKWPLIWNKCQKSWKQEFRKPEFSYQMWNDSSLRRFVKQYYPEHYDFYLELPKKINRIDLARYFILHRLGGIYADMDYECLENFYDRLNTRKASVVESPYHSQERVQNSLMASPRGNQFWLRVILEAKKRFLKGEKNTLQLTGPNLLSYVVAKYPLEVSIMPQNKYNPDMNNKKAFYQNPDVRARHYHTNTWTKSRY